MTGMTIHRQAGVVGTVMDNEHVMCELLSVTAVMYAPQW